MSKRLTIIDKDYTQWVEELSVRYHQSQIKAAIKVNREMLKYYWELGRDIEEMRVEERWGEKVMSRLSMDLCEAMPDAKCFSTTNLLYMKNFYRLYSQIITSTPQVGEQLKHDIFNVPWGYHKLLIDKCRNNLEKTVFFVRQTVENGWSRSMLLNAISTDMFERQGKALTNHRFAYLQRKRPHTGTICVGVKQPTHRHLGIRT